MDTYYRPWLVYENVCKMITHRGCELRDQPLTEADIVKRMVSPEFVIVRGTRRPGDQRGAGDVVAIIIAPDSKVAKKIAHLKKAITAALANKGATPMEILLITSELMADRLVKKEDLVEKYTDVSIFNHKYDIFIIDITDHVSAPKHELVPEAEVNQFCERYHTTRDKFSKISVTDPQSVWLGLRPGMVVKIYRISETAGIAPAFRVCSK